jgi:hypothetical protein
MKGIDMHNSHEILDFLAAGQASLADLLVRAQTGTPQSVHQLRRAIKVQRALLRLLPKQHAKPLDRSLQSVARLFAAQREAHVAAQLSAQLADTAKTKRMQVAWSALAKDLKVTAATMALPSPKALAKAAKDAARAWLSLQRLFEKPLLSNTIDKSIGRHFRQLRRLWQIKRGSRSCRAWHRLRCHLIRLHLQWRSFANVSAASAQDSVCERLRRDLGVLHDLEMLSALVADKAMTLHMHTMLEQGLEKARRLARKDSNRLFKQLFKFRKLEIR